MTYSTLIIGLAFLPLFTLVGVPGAIFAPMARTYAIAIGGGILFALTLTPVLAAKFVPAQHEEKENFLMHFLHKVYNPFFDAALRRPKRRCLRAHPHLRLHRALPAPRARLHAQARGGQLLDPRDDADVDLARKVGRVRRRACGASCAAARTTRASRAPTRTASTPRSSTVVSQLGRPDDGTDVTGFFNIEFFAPLKPFDEWPRGMTKDKLTDEINKRADRGVPGTLFNFSQYILDNVEEATAA